MRRKGMKQNIFFTSILIIVLFCSSCSGLWEVSVESLASKLKLQLKNKEFGKIYDEASDFVHRNVSREDFIKRTSKIVEELERVDENINWQPDDSLGKTFSADSYTESTYLTAYKRLENDKQEIVIFMSWEIRNGKQKISDLSAFTSSKSERPFHILTVGKIVESK